MNKKYAKKRVQLAKDVLAQLAEGKILPTNAGRYARRSRAGQCEVCALGALVVACCDPDTGNNGLSAEAVIECLTPLFSKSEMAEIEVAFEGNTYSAVLGKFLGTKLVPASRMFSLRVEAPGRITAIMENIIENKGAFVIPRVVP